SHYRRMETKGTRANPASLELLLYEIEATPREYWEDLLEMLRQFRQTLPSFPATVIDTQQKPDLLWCLLFPYAYSGYLLSFHYYCSL
ncbi:MAG: hypothetical protein AAFW75_17660, partial [Cyanobacteria bacterium J06636_16]